MMTKADNWTLFLDRDGVINKELPDDYVKRPDEFVFEPGAIEGLAMLQSYFSRLLIVTNQRGVGIGLMTQNDLDLIHQQMTDEFKTNGVMIEKIYSATDKDRQSTHRKPHPHMGLLARQDFPEIDFKKSVMVGNSRGDIEFGRNLGMITVFIDDKSRLPGEKSAYGSNFLCASLHEFALRVTSGEINFDAPLSR